MNEEEQQRQARVQAYEQVCLQYGVLPPPVGSTVQFQAVDIARAAMYERQVTILFPPRRVDMAS